MNCRPPQVCDGCWIVFHEDTESCSCLPSLQNIASHGSPASRGSDWHEADTIVGAGKSGKSNIDGAVSSGHSDCSRANCNNRVKL